MFTEVHLEPSQTSTMELFSKNSQQLITVKYFCKKALLQMFHWVLNMPLVHWMHHAKWHH